jgi:hypothetical protein
MSHQCNGITRKNERCKRRVTNGEFCYYHKCSIPPLKEPEKEIYKTDKPPECPVCYESLKNENSPLDCGHWVHIECVKKHFKPECPVCRAPVNFEVDGTYPDSNIEPPPEVIEHMEEIVQLLNQIQFLEAALNNDQPDEMVDRIITFTFNIGELE